MVNTVSAKLGVAKLTETDFEALQWLLLQPRIVAGIMVRFARHETRERWWVKRVVLKRTQDTVFVPETLTSDIKSLLRTTKNGQNRQVVRTSDREIAKFFYMRQMKNPSY